MKKPVKDAIARVELYLLGVRNNVAAADFPQALANCAELNGCVRRLFSAVKEAYKVELIRRGEWSKIDDIEGRGENHQGEIL